MADRLEAIALKIDTPTGQIVPGRGFYQLEEDALYIPVGEHSANRRFFSYLESEQVRFDIDKFGRLMLIEVDLPRRRWTVDNQLKAPSIASPADIRWLDFRARIPGPQLLTNQRRTLLMLQFAPGHSWRWYSLAESVLVQADRDHRLTAVIVTDIEDDLAGQQIAAFRKSISHDRTTALTQARTVSSISG